MVSLAGIYYPEGYNPLVVKFQSQWCVRRAEAAVDIVFIFASAILTFSILQSMHLLHEEMIKLLALKVNTVRDRCFRSDGMPELSNSNAKPPITIT